MKNLNETFEPKIQQDVEVKVSFPESGNACISNEIINYRTKLGKPFRISSLVRVKHIF